MPALIERLFGRTEAPIERASSALGFNDYLNLVNQFSFNGSTYTTGSTSTPGAEFESYVQNVHRENGVVSAAVVTRGLLLKQLRFVWRNSVRGSSNYRELFGDRNLSILERPDPGAMTRSQMLTTMEYHASYAGSAYVARHPDRLELLRPDLVDVVITGPNDPDAVLRGVGRKSGYIYWPLGREHPESAQGYRLEDLAHWMPEPDPIKWWTGASWVNSIVSDVVADTASTKYVRQFMDKAATPNMIIKPHESLSSEQIDEYRELFAKGHEGANNAFKTLWLGGGSDVMVVGSKLADLDMKNLQGGGETRIALRARIPAPILGIREGLQGSALNAGNYGSARRMLADGWFTPTAQDLYSVLETIVPPPAGAELWGDTSDLLFLQEDAKDAADILATQAAAIRALVDGGFEPDSAVKAVNDGSLSKLQHSGKLSVQLQTPGTGDTSP